MITFIHRKDPILVLKYVLIKVLLEKQGRMHTYSWSKKLKSQDKGTQECIPSVRLSTGFLEND